MTTRAAGHAAPRNGFHHEAMLFGDIEEYLTAAQDWASEGLVAGEDVVVVVPRERASLLAARLGRAADRIAFVSAEATYRDVGPMFQRFRRLVRDARRAAGGRRLRLVAEHPGIASGRMIDGELREYVNHDALCNIAFAGDHASFLCLYPRSALGTADHHRVESAHPLVRGEAGPRRSLSYTEADILIADGRREVGRYSTPAASEQVLLGSATDLRRGRALVRAVAAPLRIDADRLADYTVAVNEVATNALVHGGGDAVVAAWAEPDGRLVCDVRDPGPGPTDALAGYEPASVDARGGRGLWMARQLCTLLELGCGDAGTVVRLHLAPR